MQWGARLLVAVLSVVITACEPSSTDLPPDPIPEPQPRPEPEPQPPPPPVEPPPERPVEPPSPVTLDTISAMTFNIYHDGANETLRIGPWEARRDIVAREISEASADVVGLQEAYMWQVEWLLLQLPGYSHVGRGRDADGGGESVTILFRADRFTVEESGDFWLSDTPDRPGSIGGDAWGGMSIPRIVTWTRLGIRASDGDLYVYNAHLPPNENGGPQARRLGVILLAERIGTRSSPAAPFILLGDLNSPEDAFPLRYLTHEARADGNRLSPVRVVDTWREVNGGDRGTRCRNDFAGRPVAHGSRVDYVLAMDTTWTDDSGSDRSTADEILSARALTPMPSCGSDHIGVISRFVLP